MRMANRARLVSGEARLAARRHLPRVEAKQLEARAQAGARAASTATGPLDVTCIVFSKDRAMQLEACLRTIEQNAPYRGPIIVIYLATAPDFSQAYESFAMTDRIRMVSQSDDFRRDICDAVHAAERYTVFHTDDDFFFRPSAVRPVPTDDFACFSLRLGENTTYSYPLDRKQRVPPAIAAQSVIAWDWTRAEGDFAYPMSVNGHIFETGLVQTMLRGARFSNPNELEHELHLRRYRAQPLMLSPRKSCVVSVPVNAVSRTRNRRGQNRHYSPAALNARFLAGERIDFGAMDFSDVHGAHQEVPLVFTTDRG
ncbi:MAG: hypothetical protein M3P18_17340 [Actinomycetota bacterium]|nr:hypothetical protein [Actinomycetota bacterium]